MEFDNVFLFDKPMNFNLTSTPRLTKKYLLELIQSLPDDMYIDITEEVSTPTFQSQYEYFDGRPMRSFTYLEGLKHSMTIRIDYRQ